MSGSTSIPVPGHAELHLTTRSGSVNVVAEERADVLIESGSEDIERDPTGRISVRSGKAGSAGLDVRCPTGSDVIVGTLSGTVELQGQFGAVRVTTVSSNVSVDRADALDVRSMSGSIEVERCSERCSLQTKSGRAVIGSTGDARVSTISGRVELPVTSGKVRVQSVSGTIEVGTRSAGDVKVRTMSGSVLVAVPVGVRPATHLRSLSGRPRTDCEEGNDCQIVVQSLSGRIEVVPR